MGSDHIQAARRQRLADLVDHPDFRSKAALGAALGLKSGAFVRQMIAGERPISEKTVQAIETMRGGRYRGWFGAAESATSPAQSTAPADDWPLAPFVTRADWALLDDRQRAAVAWEASKAMSAVLDALSPSRKQQAKGRN